MRESDRGIGQPRFALNARLRTRRVSVESPSLPALRPRLIARSRREIFRDSPAHPRRLPTTTWTSSASRS